MEKIAFVILTWNSGHCIERCIKSIQKMTGFDKHICIVDNGSIDNTTTTVKKYEGNTDLFCLELINLGSNKGTTVSRNIGIKRIPVDVKYLCILDSDTVLNSTALVSMIQVLNENERNGIVGPKMKSLDGTIQVSARKIPIFWMKLMKILPIKYLSEWAQKKEAPITLNRDVFPAGYLMSACWLMRKDIVEKIGLLDEKIFYAPEDVEFCIRAWKNGYRVLHDKRAVIVHEWQRLSRKKIFSKHNFEHIKGLIYLYNKYGIWVSAKSVERLVH